MSHSHERKEKICLNCKAALHGRYCHLCGQQNIEPKESVWGLITHFFYDITHFDGSFFRTTKHLIVKPGYLSKEYIRGRRANYLHPVRMYIFTSAFFFIIFFSMYDTGDIKVGTPVRSVMDSSTKSMKQAEAEALMDASTTEDSLQVKKIFNALNKVPLPSASDSSGKSFKSSFTLVEPQYQTKAAYDSAQMRLPAKARDSWFKRTKMYKQIEINEKFINGPDAFVRSWLGILLHMFPQLLFVSLPLFALILKMLYVRQRQYYYADHAIFGVHLYIFSFIAMLLFFTISRLKEYLHWNWMDFILGGIALYMLFYTYNAMRNFYGQNRVKTLVKYGLLNLMSLIVILILFIGFFMLSLFKI